jgi:hypothetical protein
MHDETAAAAAQQLREVLLGYLQAAGSPPWPGADSLTVADVLASYPAAAASGQVPDRATLLLRHPELADALVAWPAGLGRSSPGRP